MVVLKEEEECLVQQVVVQDKVINKHWDDCLVLGEVLAGEGGQHKGRWCGVGGVVGVFAVVEVLGQEFRTFLLQLADALGVLEVPGGPHIHMWGVVGVPTMGLGVEKDGKEGCVAKHHSVMNEGQHDILL